MIRLFPAALLALLLAGCQMMSERVADRARLVCFEAGYGETSPNHAECMRSVQPVGLAMERKQALDEGFALIGKGLHPNDLTCVGSGSVVTCHE